MKSRNVNRKLGVFFVLVILILFFSTGCQTTEAPILPGLPSYSPFKPDRPELLSSEGAQLPMNVQINTVKLMSYAEQLEIYAQGWEEFYEGLRTVYGGQNVNN